MVKKKLLISFSGGETSAYMAARLLTEKRDEYEIALVFANTGQENEETLVFVEAFAKHFKVKIYWIEGLHFYGLGKGTRFKLVDFETADRVGRTFESFVSVYGLPNSAAPQCTRELKGAPIKAFARLFLGWRGYYTAIGIRADEADRMTKSARNSKFIYPLISTWPTTKPEVNAFWAAMPFRLKLKGYEGNCVFCWKKSKKKLLKIAQERPEVFAFPAHLEATYGDFFPAHRAEAWRKAGKEIPKNIKMFRGSVSALDILAEAATLPPVEVSDDSVEVDILGSPINPDDLDLVGGDSCEVWADCRSDDELI